MTPLSNYINNLQQNDSPSSSVAPAAIRDPSNSETLEGDALASRSNNITFSDSDSKLLEQVKTIIEEGLRAGVGIPSNDSKQLQKIAVNLVYAKRQLDLAVYDNATGIIPVVLERKGDELNNRVKSLGQERDRYRIDAAMRGSETTEEMKLPAWNLSDEEQKILRERAHCSAVFLMPRHNLKLEGSKMREEMTGLDQRPREVNRDKPQEHHFGNGVSIKPESFVHVLIPERYRKLTNNLENTLSSKGCQLHFVADKEAEELNLKWTKVPLKGKYPDYRETLGSIYSNEDYAMITLVIHATRSEGESTGLQGWLKV